MCTCHPHLVWHSGCVLYPTLSPYLGGHACLPWWIWPVHFTLSLWGWQTCLHCGYDLLLLPGNSLGVLLGTPSAGLLISSSHLLPSVGFDFRVSFEHSTLSPLNLILKLSCLVFKSLAKIFLLVYVTSSQFFARGLSFQHWGPWSRTVVLRSATELLCVPCYMPVSSKCMTHGWGRD